MHSCRGGNQADAIEHSRVLWPRCRPQPVARPLPRDRQW
jgi:hypothetical protein